MPLPDVCSFSSLQLFGQSQPSFLVRSTFRRFRQNQLIFVFHELAFVPAVNDGDGTAEHVGSVPDIRQALGKVATENISLSKEDPIMTSNDQVFEIVDALVQYLML